MAEIVNLKLARKRKAREESAAVADENRAKFGQTKQAKKLRDAEASLAGQKLDGHKREDD